MFEVIWANTVVVAPQPGDILVVDNFLMKHGRMGFPEGVDRKAHRLQSLNTPFSAIMDLYTRFS